MSVADLVAAARTIAEHHGYAIGVHGTQRRDLDLIAAPWVEHADSADELAHAIADGLAGAIVIHNNDGTICDERPHGRRGYVIGGPGAQVRRGEFHVGPAYIDLSVMPRTEAA